MHTIEKLDSKGLRKFGLMTGAVIVVLFGLLLPWLLSHGWPRWPWILAALLWVPALVYPKVLGPVYTGWMKFGAVAGFINTKIIMAILYYLVVVPIGLVMRVFGHDPMRRKLGGVSSYRIESKNNPVKNMEKPF